MYRTHRSLTAFMGLFAGLALALTVTPSAAAAETSPPPTSNIPSGTQTVPAETSAVMTSMTADRCTTAPGASGTGSHNCVVVHGDGNRIDSAYSEYYYAQPVGPSVCDRHHQFQYTDGWGTVITREVDPGGCINSGAMVATGDYVSLPEAPTYAMSGTSFCTRVMNDQTGGMWSPYSCIGIV